MFAHSLRLGSLIIFFILLTPAIPVRGESEEHCKSYACSAIDQYNRARYLGIPNLPHDVWIPNYSHHYNWCIKATEALVNNGRKQRENVIKNFCMKNHGDYQIYSRQSSGRFSLHGIVAPQCIYHPSGRGRGRGSNARLSKCKYHHPPQVRFNKKLIRDGFQSEYSLTKSLRDCELSRKMDELLTSHNWRGIV